LRPLGQWVLPSAGGVHFKVHPRRLVALDAEDCGVPDCLQPKARAPEESFRPGGKTKRQERANIADVEIVENESILIIEDDPMNVKLVQVVLSGEGYDLRSASHADAALNVLATFRPGLILMDIQLPGKSGIELTRQLLADTDMQGTKIVALTGYGRKDDEHNCLNAGCEGYIAKPIDTSTFPATIRCFLDKRSRPAPKVQVDGDLLRERRNIFIIESLAELDELLSVEFRSKNRLLRALHRWAGIAGTLGIPDVTEQARKTEVLLESTDEIDVPVVSEALDALWQRITAAAAAPAFELALPNEIGTRLSGKRIGMVGFSPPEANRIAKILDCAECFTLCIETPPDGLSMAAVQRFDIVILNLSGAAGFACHKHTSSGLDKPFLLVGSRACISGELVSIEAPARDFLSTPWDSEELLVRCCRLLPRILEI
jgi:two-component system cell cycle response regulator DivK